MTYAELLRRYRAKHGKLVAPDSLQPDLHLAFSMGMKRGFTNLGTYGRKPGDHGYYPSWAFDLGREDRFLFKGWGYLKARNLAKLYVENHKALHIEYVILGMRIWSRSRPYWHDYGGDRSHMFHIHVSGHHSD